MKLISVLAVLLMTSTVFAGVCPDPEDFNCRQPKNCQGPYGRITEGSSLTAYAQSQVTAPDVCESETRVCSEGRLTGSYTNLNCTVLPGRDDFR